MGPAPVFLLYINCIIKYKYVCVWLLSVTIMFVILVRIVIFIGSSILLYSIPLYEYTTMYLSTVLPMGALAVSSLGPRGTSAVNVLV